MLLRRLPSKVHGASQNHGISPCLFFTCDRIVKEPSPPTQPAGASFRGSRHRPAFGEYEEGFGWVRGVIQFLESSHENRLPSVLIGGESYVITVAKPFKTPLQKILLDP